MSKIKNIKNFDKFKDQFKDYDGYAFYLEEYRDKLSAHVCKCGHFGAAPKKCSCKVLDVHAQSGTYDLSGLDSSNVTFFPETLKGSKISDTLYTISADAFVFNYDKTTETLNTSVMPHSLIFDREKWELVNVKSIASNPMPLSLAKASVLLELLAKAIPSEYDYLNKLSKGLSFTNTNLFNASRESIDALKSDTFLNMDHLVEDNLMSVFYKYGFRDTKMNGVLTQSITTIEQLLGKPIDVLADKHGKELLYAASYISNKEEFHEIVSPINNVSGLFDYITYPPSRVNLSNILRTLKSGVEDLWIHIYDKYPTELFHVSNIYPYWNTLMSEEIRFIETFFKDNLNSGNHQQIAYYRYSSTSLSYSFQTYNEHKKFIYDEDDSYNEKVKKVENLGIFYKQMTGVLKNDLSVIMKQFNAYSEEKNRAKANPNYGVRDYMQAVLKNDLDTKIKAAGKVDFFIELLDQDALYALKLLNTKGRLTKEMKLEAIQKLAK